MEVIHRLAYQHISGEVFVVLGEAKHQKEETEIVIISSLTTGKLLYFEKEKFFDKHPKTGVPRFQLVTQTRNNLLFYKLLN